MSRPRIAFAIALTSCLLLAHRAGAGTNFSPGELTSVPAKPDFMASGDLDNDGRADLVVSSPQSNNITVFLAADTPSHVGAARAFQFGEAIQDLAIGDINADGKQDVVVADHQADGFWFLLGDGNGSFQSPRLVSVNTSRRPVAVAIGNFDDIGNLDIAVADDSLNRIFILRNDNQNPPGFLSGGDFGVGDRPVSIRSVDLNRDGKLDLLTLNIGGPRVKDVSVALWRRAVQGFPEFETPQSYVVGERPESLVVADFNHDGAPDVAMLNRPIASEGNSEIETLLNQGNGVLSPPLVHPVPCPFFTGGAPCKSLVLAAGDFDSNGNIDLIVALSDPRRTRGSASSEADAMQAFSGNGDGTFDGGGTLTIQKIPLSLAVADVSGDGPPEVVVANQRTLDLQVFVNTSTPGDKEIGEPCDQGEECISDRCTNGVCCADLCDPEQNEVCNIVGREGTCIPIPPVPQECTAPEPEPDPACPLERRFCVDGFCCDETCEGGRCDVQDVIGVCIPGIPDGEDCSGDDEECSSGFCSDNFICCRESCDGAFCEPGTGVCRSLFPTAVPCDADEECQSGVCDEFDRICCNRRCNPGEVCFPGEGICRPDNYTPSPVTGSPTATATPTPQLTPQPTGARCFFDDDCTSGICDDLVCCKEECDDQHHCEEGTGNCVEGPAPTSPSPTPIPTPLPTATPEDPCLNIECPAGQTCLGGLCVETSTGSGCSTGGGDQPAAGNWIALGLLPFALWVTRRWQLHRVRVRRRAR